MKSVTAIATPVNRHTTFEAPIYTRYEDVKGGAKYGKCCDLGAVRDHSKSSAMSQFEFHRAHITFYSTLIETMQYTIQFSGYSELFLENRRF